MPSTRSKRGCAPIRGSGLQSFGRLRLGKRLERRLQIAFRVDQKSRGGDDLFAGRQPFNDLDTAIAAATEFDRAWLKAAFALRHQHDLTRPAVDDGAGWDRRNRDTAPFNME